LIEELKNQGTMVEDLELRVKNWECNVEFSLSN
jgi:hypothetical protein